LNIYFETSLNVVLKELFDVNVSVISETTTTGGSINETSILQLDNDQKVFIKKNKSSLKNMFKAEAEGLLAMSEIEGGPRIPGIMAVIQNNDYQYLILEAIEQHKPGDDFWQKFGKSLANMHKKKFSQYGFEIDNYIGATEQKNQFENDWISFFREHRLGYQSKLAFDSGLISLSEFKKFEEFQNRLSEYIEKDNFYPSLLHGDLWSGNYMVDENGNPVLIDPAVYYGDAEADLAMTMLFGRFSEEFYQSYFDTFGPPDNGFEDRMEIYQLYHLLNHLNLFGKSYLSACLKIVNKFS